jgi:hypothetical protein
MALNVGKNLITPEAIKGVLNTGKDYLIQEGTNYAGNNMGLIQVGVNVARSSKKRIL